MRPCGHDDALLPTLGAAFVMGQCRVCYLYVNDENYRAKFDATPTDPTVACRHLQLETVLDRKGRLCQGCWTMGCDRLGSCTRTVRDGDLPLCAECDYHQPDDGTPDRVIAAYTLVNDLCPGDNLAMTAAVYSLHKRYPRRFATEVESFHPQLWENNPHTRRFTDAERVGAKRIEIHYPLVNRSNQLPIHFVEAYCRGLGEALGVPLAAETNRPHIVLRDEERVRVNPVVESFGYSGKFWLVNAGHKSDYTAKWWGGGHYQELIDLLRGKVQFVQVGSASDNHPRIAGAFDLVGKTDLRQMLRLAHHSAGAVGPSTFLQHASAAFEKPYVCIAGGREPVSWMTYPKQTTLHTIGRLPCCQQPCWRTKTTKDQVGKPGETVCERPVQSRHDIIPQCLDSIRPAQVADAILGYGSAL
jgi:ADP-heptose:LPS heptosyltransferase